MYLLVDRIKIPQIEKKGDKLYFRIEIIEKQKLYFISE